MNFIVQDFITKNLLEVLEEIAGVKQQQIRNLSKITYVFLMANNLTKNLLLRTENFVKDKRKINILLEGIYSFI